MAGREGQFASASRKSVHGYWCRKPRREVAAAGAGAAAAAVAAVVAAGNVTITLQWQKKLSFPSLSLSLTKVPFLFSHDNVHLYNCVLQLSNNLWVFCFRLLFYIWILRLTKRQYPTSRLTTLKPRNVDVLLLRNVVQHILKHKLCKGLVDYVPDLTYNNYYGASIHEFCVG